MNKHSYNSVTAYVHSYILHTYAPAYIACVYRYILHTYVTVQQLPDLHKSCVLWNFTQVEFYMGQKWACHDRMCCDMMGMF